MSLICRIYTRQLERREAGKPTETGIFEHEVFMDLPAIKAVHGNNTREFVMKEISIHLANCVATTGIPLEIWTLEFTPFAQTTFNLPHNMEAKL